MKRFFHKALLSLAVALTFIVSQAPNPMGLLTSPAATVEQGTYHAFVTLTGTQNAEAAAMSNFLQNKFLDFLLRAQAYTAPTTVYVALATTTGTAAACGTEVTGGSYARVAVTTSLANFAGTQSAGSTTASSGTSGQTSNNNSITFPSPTANWGTVTSFCVMDASSGGNLLFFAALTVSKTINNGRLV